MWLVGSFQSPRANRQQSKFQDVFYWNQIDYAFESDEDRQSAIEKGDYIPQNNLPLGLERWKERVFVSIPRWKLGIPATLAVVSMGDSDPSPLLRPYPNWSWHESGNCNGLTSVFRMAVDSCGRLWVLDSGILDALNEVKVICPPQVFVFDLTTDRLLWKYEIPKSQAPDGALFTNIVVDIRDGMCDDAFAYITDVFRYGLVVYSWRDNRSWRVSHPYFYPDPLVCRYDLDGIVFRWTDGVFGLALSPVNPRTNERTLFFHPMSSFREFYVSTEHLRIENASLVVQDEFMVTKEPRGRQNSHSSASAMDRDGVLFYNLVTNNAVGCWNSRNEYLESSQGVVEQSNVTLNFPNDLKIDHEEKQSLWVLSNRLHRYLYRSLDPDEINFRIMRVGTEDAVRGTVCEAGGAVPRILPKRRRLRY